MESDYSKDLIITSSTTNDQHDPSNNSFLLPSHDSTAASTETQHNATMMKMKMPLQQESLERDGLVNIPELCSGTGRSRSLHNKRRKALQKRSVCVSAVGSSSSAGSRGSMGESCLPHDMWTWRKYGQKPIKGSPYPRGYYKCSSSKGCPARKQVERSQTESNMLLITYASEHNHAFPTHHRNALAGSTRHNLHPASSNSTPATAQVQEEDRQLQAECSREVQIIPNSKSLVENRIADPYLDSVLLPVEEICEESKMLRNYLLSERIQDFDEGMSIDSHNTIMEAFIDHRSDYEEDEAVLMEGIAPVDPYNLFEWSSSPHLS